MGKNKTTTKKKPRSYSTRKWNQLKMLYVEQGMTCIDIARLDDKNPTQQSIYNRSKKKQPNGLTWEDEKNQRIEAHYNSIAPQSQVNLILGKINQTLLKPGLDTKDSDALVKYHKFLKEMTDWRYHAPMIFQVIDRLLDFVSANYPELLKDKDSVFTNTIRHFKNDLIKELGEVNFTGVKSTQN